MELDARGLVTLAASQIGDDNKQWIEVMPTATEARNGPWFFTITADDLNAYADYIRGNPGTIPVDYDHEGARQDGSTKAAGWFTGEARVDDRDDTPLLMAEVQWTPTGAQAIKDGDFKMISPEFSFHDREAKTGLMTRAKQIIAATLTNRPFFKTLAPVAAELEPEQIAALADTDDEMEIRTILAASTEPYGDVEYADPGHQKDGKKRYPLDTDEHIRAAWSYINQEKNAGKYSSDDLASIKSKIRAAMNRIGADVTATETEGDDMDLKLIAAALGLPEDADEATILAKTKEAKAAADVARARTGGRTGDVSLFAEALGLAETADEATVLAAVRRAAEDSDRVTAFRDEHDNLTAAAADKVRLEARIKAIEAERKQEKIQRILTDAIRDGQVLPAEKTVLARTFADNPDALAEIIDARPKRSFRAAGAGGEGMEDSVDVRAASQRFESVEADGVDPDSARLHVRAEQYLKERGKQPGQYSELEYAQAVEAVELERQFA